MKTKHKHRQKLKTKAKTKKSIKHVPPHRPAPLVWWDTAGGGVDTIWSQSSIIRHFPYTPNPDTALGSPLADWCMALILDFSMVPPGYEPTAPGNALRTSFGELQYYAADQGRNIPPGWGVSYHASSVIVNAAYLGQDYTIVGPLTARAYVVGRNPITGKMANYDYQHDTWWY